MVFFQSNLLEKEFGDDLAQRKRIIFGCKAEILNNNNVINTFQQQRNGYLKQQDIIYQVNDNQKQVKNTQQHINQQRFMSQFNTQTIFQDIQGTLLIMVKFKIEKENEYNANSFVIATIVSVVVLVFLLIFVIFCARRRRLIENKKREESLKRAREELSRNNPQSNINQSILQNLLSHDPMSIIAQSIFMNLPSNNSIEKQEKQYFQDLEKCFPLMSLNQIHEYFKEEVPNMKQEDINKECSICCCDFEEDQDELQIDQNESNQKSNTSSQTCIQQNKNKTIELEMTSKVNNDKLKNNKPSLRLFTFCNHFFHQNCIHDWLKKNKNCPICRQNLTQFELNQIKNHIEDKVIERTKRLIEKMKNINQDTETKNKLYESQSQNVQQQQLQAVQQQQQQPQQQEMPQLQLQVLQQNQVSASISQNQIPTLSHIIEITQSENNKSEQLSNSQQILQNNQRGDSQLILQTQIGSQNLINLQEIENNKFQFDNKINQFYSLSPDGYLNSIQYSPIKLNLGSIEDISPNKQSNNNIQMTGTNNDIQNLEQELQSKIQFKQSLIHLRSPKRTRKDDYNHKRHLKQSSLILDKSPSDKNTRNKNRSLILGQTGLNPKSPQNLSHNNFNDSSIISDRLQVSEMEQSIIIEEDEFKLNIQIIDIEDTDEQQNQDHVKNIQLLELIKEDDEEDEKNQNDFNKSGDISLTQQNKYTIMNHITSQKNIQSIQQNNNQGKANDFSQSVNNLQNKNTSTQNSTIQNQQAQMQKI